MQLIEAVKYRGGIVRCSKEKMGRTIDKIRKAFEEDIKSLKEAE